MSDLICQSRMNAMNGLFHTFFFFVQSMVKTQKGEGYP